MRGRPSVWARTRRLETRAASRDLRGEAARLAAELGIGADELRAEAEELARRCRAAGAVTHEQMAAVAAAEAGLEPAEVRAEAERILAGWPR